MPIVILPAIWLLVLLVGLPQFSETVYTPSLPEIAAALQVHPALVEYTLTIYLFGFAIGTLLWGNFSDRFGRKPGVLIGLVIFILGCIGCYLADSINMLLLSRFIQAVGASVGSVLGQAICRDAFKGAALGRVYSLIGSALALFPALGPVLGGLVAQYSGWQNIFLMLILMGIIVSVMVIWRLPETHDAKNWQPVSILQIAKRLFRDKRAIYLALVIGASNGISFSYFAEGSFYLINLLGLSPSQYGMTFIAIAASAMVGGLVSRKLHNHCEPQKIMQYGTYIVLLGSSLFCLLILISLRWPLSNPVLIMVVVGAQMIMMFGICIIISSALATALRDYKDSVGTASSLFGFFYYVLIGLFTLGMGLLHNGTLFPMPFYFLLISLLMYIVGKRVKD